MKSKNFVIIQQKREDKESMKLKALIILTGLTILICGCNQSESSDTTQTEITIIETEAVETKAPAEPVEAETEVESADTEEDKYSVLDPSTQLTFNEDGTVIYTEEFAGAISMRPYFQGASQEEIDEFLKGFLPLCEGMSGQDIDLLLSMFDNSNLHSENETYNQSEGIVDNSNNSENNNSSSSNNSNSGNNTPAYENQVVENPEDWNDSNPDSSVWGNANFNNDNHGGGYRDITGATIGTP